MTTIEFDAEFDSIVNEILLSPSGDVKPVRVQIDERLASVAQLALWDTEYPNVSRGEE